MGRAPCCDKANVKKGPWSPEEDSKLKEYIEKNGTGGNWIALPQKAGLKRCGKSCRLRWLNYLRPNIKHGEFSDEEDRIICTLYANIGSRWSIIAAQLPGRTDNDIKNYWNTKLKKKLMNLIPPFESSNLNPPFSSPQLLSFSMYRNHNSCYNSPETMSLTGLESISVPSSVYNTSNVFQLSQNQEFSVPAMQYFYPALRDMLASEASCSSSDGSCGQISHGREIKQEEMTGFQNYMSSGFEEYGNRSMLSHGSSSSNNEGGQDMNRYWAEKPIGSFVENNPLDYDLEDIKKLISCNSSSINYGFFN